MGQFMSAGERTCNTATRTRAIFPGGTPQININRLQSSSRNSYEDAAAPLTPTSAGEGVIQMVCDSCDRDWT